MQNGYVRMQLAIARAFERRIEERGATAVEYAIMLAFIAAVIIVAVAFLGNATKSGFSTVKFP